MQLEHKIMILLPQVDYKKLRSALENKVNLSLRLRERERERAVGRSCSGGRVVAVSGGGLAWDINILR